MPTNTLEPNLDLLTKEYVLIQAWKKTVSYIRSHNWYADTLELDRAAVNLPEFIKEVADRFSEPDLWENDPIRIVPAPKSQQWLVDEEGHWKPTNRQEVAKGIRPLAHVTLRDQVAATALMLCLADRVESMQGNPRVSIDLLEDRSTVTSYGNRLFCDSTRKGLQHRWGSSKLYRAYFQDYRKFLLRPEIVAEKYEGDIVIVHSDLRNFYDRVSPELLFRKIEKTKKWGDDEAFFDLARRMLCWKWHKNDEKEVANYASKSNLDDFTTIALPQGLVASGFLSNIVMLDFDQQIRNFMALGADFIDGARLLDGCRYVDDIRLVLLCNKKMTVDEIKKQIVDRLQAILNETTPGAVLSLEKTQATFFRGDRRPLVRQSRKMERIQTAISGGFDAIAGEEILESIQGLVRAQSRYSKDRVDGQGWLLSPVADVRDETVARFAAARFRTTYRSLRPLLESQKDDKYELDKVSGEVITEDTEIFIKRKTQQELDDEARAFAFGLIENWVEDPSNVRLLRIALDVWPEKEILEKVLGILGQYTSKDGGRNAPRRIAWYCLAEIFRAGATETGFVADGECLPDGINIEEYRATLYAEAVSLVECGLGSLPWYLKQQILFFIAVNNPAESPVFRAGRNSETKHYRELIRYLRGDSNGLLDRDYAIYAILARRSFAGTSDPVKLANAGLSPNRAKHIAELDSSFANEVFSANPEIIPQLPSRIRLEICRSESTMGPEGKTSLAKLLWDQKEEDRSKLANELTLLTFAAEFLSSWSQCAVSGTLTPSDVYVSTKKSERYGEVFSSIVILPQNTGSNYSLYDPPGWCQLDERWRFQLGSLLRFILTGQHDYSKSVKPVSWNKPGRIYRVPESHWYQRSYGLHSGYTAFGADWLPITDWIERFLYALLRWPGCRPSEFSKKIELGIDETLTLLKGRISELHGLWGGMSDVLMLPLTPKWPEKPLGKRPLRVCVVQTITPSPEEVRDSEDLTLSEPTLRKRHRNHLSAALEAIKGMLALRDTHNKRDGKLDLLILPELSVHPEDVKTHLVPFARAYRTVILAGLTYEELFTGKPLINSALWIIPAWTEDRGLEVLCRRQGKMNLSPDEKRRNDPQVKLQGFRPCQWLVGYPWNISKSAKPLWLTGAICYDATDIRLAADLRDKSDVFAVSAMNRDVKTFDHMALALQYHMFQMVIIANNGHFGGSSAYAPYTDPYERQVFHLHGRQALMAFLEIDPIEEFLARRNHNEVPPSSGSAKKKNYKCPPANICKGNVCFHKVG